MLAEESELVNNKLVNTRVFRWHLEFLVSVSDCASASDVLVELAFIV